MKRIHLKDLIFMALCCDFGIAAKKLILPLANVITDALHIPGGIGTSFSLLFITVGAAVLPYRCSATLMCTAQSVIAVCLGTVGSMGLLMPVGYILPGAVIDLTLHLSRRAGKEPTAALLAAGIFSSVTACLTANAIVFHLSGLVLALYAALAALSGAICSVPAAILTKRLLPLCGRQKENPAQ